MNQSVLIITDFNEIFPGSTQAVDSQSFDLTNLFQDIVKNSTEKCFLLRVADPEAYFKKIKSSVTLIKAAGGLVKNADLAYLFIKRLGKWDLPKGKVESGEHMAETAVREVEEECGVQIEELGKKIRSTFHVYFLRGELILKKTNWYHMSVTGVPDLIPQLEEDIQEAVWLKPEALKPVLANTYPLISELIADLFPETTG